MDDRNEMRRLIDMVEKSASSNSVEQAVDDLKLFANTASFLANKLDTRLKSGDAKRKKPTNKTSARSTSPKPPAPALPKSQNTPKPQGNVTGMPRATSSSISQADYDRLKPSGSIGALGSNVS